MLNASGFEVIIASLPGHEKLVAEVHYDGRFVALVSQELEENNYQIEFPDNTIEEDRVVRHVNFHGFIEALVSARNRLKNTT